MKPAGDVHTHVWLREHLSDEFRSDLAAIWPEVTKLDASPEAHFEHVAAAVGRSVVLAFDAEHSGIVVPNEFVADYVARDPSRLVGFCSVEPRRPDALDRLACAVEDLGLRGVKLAPTYQGFDPLGAEAFRLYERIAEYRLPTLWHQGTTFVRNSILKYAFPHQLDDVARAFPELRIVIAHLGHPWIGECIAVVRKHPFVFADISGLAGRPIQFREALTLAGEYRIAGKLLFGTDYPFAVAADVRSALVQIAADAAAPHVLRQTAATILTTDPLAAIGL